MPGFLVRNWRLKLLALVLAIVAWVGVVYAANPVGQKTVLVAVHQSNALLPAGYVLTSSIPEQTVLVTGTQDHLASFDANTLQVSVDYQVISRIGNHVPATVDVPLTVTNNDPNVQISYAKSVQADVDKSGKLSAPVTVNITKPLQAGYVIPSPPTVSLSMVTLQGPEHDLTGAVVKTDPIDLSNTESDYRKTLNVYAYDPSGRNRLDRVNVDPPSVTVTIAVKEVSTSRTSSLVLGPLRGILPGYEVSSISYTPMSVTLTGPQNILNQSSLGQVTTAAIDLADRFGTNSYTVTIPSPTSDVTVSPATVRVTVTIVPIPTPTPAPTPTPTPTPTTTPSP